MVARACPFRGHRRTSNHAVSSTVRALPPSIAAARATARGRGHRFPNQSVHDIAVAVGLGLAPEPVPQPGR